MGNKPNPAVKSATTSMIPQPFKYPGDFTPNEIPQPLEIKPIPFPKQIIYTVKCYYKFDYFVNDSTESDDHPKIQEKEDIKYLKAFCETMSKFVTQYSEKL